MIPSVHSKLYSSLAGLDGKQVQNILLPPEHQNADWFRLPGVTLIDYHILSKYHALKHSCPSLSVEAYANYLASCWGVSSRLEEGDMPEPNKMPKKTVIRTTAVNHLPAILSSSMRSDWLLPLSNRP